MIGKFKPLVAKLGNQPVAPGIPSLNHLARGREIVLRVPIFHCVISVANADADSATSSAEEIKAELTMKIIGLRTYSTCPARRKPFCEKRCRRTALLAAGTKEHYLHAREGRGKNNGADGQQERGADGIGKRSSAITQIVPPSLEATAARRQIATCHLWAIAKFVQVTPFADRRGVAEILSSS